MRRFLGALVASLVLTAALSSVATATKPSYGCPADASGYMLVDRDAWWDITVDGFAIAGIPVYEADGVTFTAAFDAFAAAAGFGDGAGLEAFIRGAQWAIVDKNGNDYACLKLRQVNPGNPGYFVVGVDDNASKR